MANPLYQLLCDLDREGAGVIDFEKFVLFLTTTVTGQESREEMLEMFQLFDDEKTGKISLGGLRRMAATYHLEWEEEDLQEMIRQADTDGDGRVSFEEFHAILSCRPSLL
jgi:centrin-1